jgi:hypothetical protein
MFDDLNQQNVPNQTGQKINNNPAPATAEDMFADIEPAIEKPVQFQPRTSNVDEVVVDNGANKGNMQKVFVLAMTVLGFVLLGVGAYFGYGYLMAKKAAVIIKNEPIVEVQKPVENAAADDAASTTANVPQEAGIDTDKDGLTDAEEQQLGTNINSTDTDSDGLFDREEVKVYKTNVLTPDTDGDGMSDGDEVKIGRNPNGEGSLLNTVATSTTSVESETAAASTSASLQSNQTAGSAPVVTEPAKDEVAPADNKLVGATIDSDQDGLTDVEEIKYGTDPLDSDSDGDTYLDGAEVKGGYNPLGAGKLIK